MNGIGYKRAGDRWLPCGGGGGVVDRLGFWYIASHVFHNSYSESVRIDDARHRHSVSMQAGKESFPICGGGTFLPAAAHVSYPVKGSACRCHITVVEQHERLNVMVKVSCIP